MGILAVAVSYIVENGRFLLSNLLLENAKVLSGNVEYLCSFLVEYNSLCIVALFDFFNCLVFGSLNLLLDLVKLWLQFCLLRLKLFLLFGWLGLTRSRG